MFFFSYHQLGLLFWGLFYYQLHVLCCFKAFHVAFMYTTYVRESGSLGTSNCVVLLHQCFLFHHDICFTSLNIGLHLQFCHCCVRAISANNGITYLDSLMLMTL